MSKEYKPVSLMTKGILLNPETGTPLTLGKDEYANKHSWAYKTYASVQDPRLVESKLYSWVSAQSFTEYENGKGELKKKLTKGFHVVKEIVALKRIREGLSELPSDANVEFVLGGGDTEHGLYLSGGSGELDLVRFYVPYQAENNYLRAACQNGANRILLVVDRIRPYHVDLAKTALQHGCDVTIQDNYTASVYSMYAVTNIKRYPLFFDYMVEEKVRDGEPTDAQVRANAWIQQQRAAWKQTYLWDRLNEVIQDVQDACKLAQVDGQLEYEILNQTDDAINFAGAFPDSAWSTLDETEIEEFVHKYIRIFELDIMQGKYTRDSATCLSYRPEQHIKHRLNYRYTEAKEHARDNTTKRALGSTQLRDTMALYISVKAYLEHPELFEGENTHLRAYGHFLCPTPKCGAVLTTKDPVCPVCGWIIPKEDVEREPWVDFSSIEARLDEDISDYIDVHGEDSYYQARTSRKYTRNIEGNWEDATDKDSPVTIKTVEKPVYTDEKVKLSSNTLKLLAV